MDAFYDDMDEAVTKEAVEEMLAMPDFKTKHAPSVFVMDVCESQLATGSVTYATASAIYVPIYRTLSFDQKVRLAFKRGWNFGE